MLVRWWILLLASLSITAFAGGESSSGLTLTPSADNAQVYIINLKEGDAVTNPVRILFGLRNMGIAPAGVERANTGHHHLLIDTSLPVLDLPIPSVPNQSIHFGLGQTETLITLPPGEHTLQLLFGDHRHVPHTPAVISKKITITVLPEQTL